MKERVLKNSASLEAKPEDTTSCTLPYLIPALRSPSHQEIRDPALLYDALKPSAPISHCHSLVPDGQCLHRVGYLGIADTVMVSQAGTATDFEVEHTPFLHLVACMAGGLHLGADGGHVTNHRDGVMLLPTGMRRTRGSHSLVAITIHPDAVAQAAAAMAGLPLVPRRKLEGFSRFQPLALQPRRSAAPIHALIRSIDTCALEDPQLPERLGLDDVIHRCVAVLLEPALLHKEPDDLLRFRDADGRNSFDDLIDFIRANLDQPLRLSDLEARSHYSRRALQYAFRERLNCTPKQWIRQQRLALAMEQLQGADNPTTVRAVALRCGYSNASAFSADFKARYGLSPNQVRRGW